MMSNANDLDMRELEIRSRELDLREEEIQIKRDDLMSRKATKTHWLLSPVVLPVFATLSGFLATGYSLHKQALSSIDLEQKKMEYSLIQNALADPNKKQAIRNLDFLEEIGLIKQVSLTKIVELSRNADKAPSFAGAVIRDEVISVEDAKRMLKKEGAYDGPVDNSDDRYFRNAIARFQMMRGKTPDGLLGPCTLQQLWSATAEVLPASQEGKSVAVSGAGVADNCK